MLECMSKCSISSRHPIHSILSHMIQSTWDSKLGSRWQPLELALSQVTWSPRPISMQSMMFLLREISKTGPQNLWIFGFGPQPLISLRMASRTTEIFTSPYIPFIHLIFDDSPSFQHPASALASAFTFYITFGVTFTFSIHTRSFVHSTKHQQCLSILPSFLHPVLFVTSFSIYLHSFAIFYK